MGSDAQRQHGAKWWGGMKAISFVAAGRGVMAWRLLKLVGKEIEPCLIQSRRLHPD